MSTNEYPPPLFLLCVAAARHDAPLVRRRHRHPHRSAPLLLLSDPFGCGSLLLFLFSLPLSHFPYPYSYSRPCAPVSPHTGEALPQSTRPAPVYLHWPCLPVPILRARIPAYHSPPAHNSRLSRGNVKVVGACSAASVPMVRYAVLTVRSPPSPNPFSPLSFHPCVGCSWLIALIALFAIQSSLKIRSASSRHRRRSSPDRVSTRSTPDGRSPPPAA